MRILPRAHARGPSDRVRTRPEPQDAAAPVSARDSTQQRTAPAEGSAPPSAGTRKAGEATAKRLGLARPKPGERIPARGPSASAAAAACRDELDATARAPVPRTGPLSIRRDNLTSADDVANRDNAAREKHFVREARRWSIRGHLIRASSWLADQAREVGDQDRADTWAEKSSRFRMCGYKRRYECSPCGTGYARTEFQCQQRLCPYCAAMRISVVLERVWARLVELEATHRAYLLTFTLPDREYEGLVETVKAVDGALASLKRRRAFTSQVAGWLAGIEVKRGGGTRGGRWHTHVHMVVLLPLASCPARPLQAVPLKPFADLMAVWREKFPHASMLAQHVQPVRDQKGLKECVKYSAKMDSLIWLDRQRQHLRPIELFARDVDEVATVLRKRRLVRTGGLLHGCESDDDQEAPTVEELRESEQPPECVTCGAVGFVRMVFDKRGWKTVVERRACAPLIIRGERVRGWSVVDAARDELGAELRRELEGPPGPLFASYGLDPPTTARKTA